MIRTPSFRVSRHTNFPFERIRFSSCSDDDEDGDGGGDGDGVKWGNQCYFSRDPDMIPKTVFMVELHILLLQTDL